MTLIKFRSSLVRNPRHSPTSKMTKFTRLTIATTNDNSRNPCAFKVVTDPAQPIRIMVTPLKQFNKREEKNKEIK